MNVLEIFISSDVEDRTVATGFTVCRDYLPVHSETAITVFSQNPPEHLVQYYALKTALLFRLKIASDEETYVHCPGVIYAELTRLKAPKNAALWSECYSLLHGLQRPMEVAICRDVRHQRQIAEAVAKLLSQNRPAIPAAPPNMTPELPVVQLARLLRSLYPSEFLEELSERLIFS